MIHIDRSRCIGDGFCVQTCPMRDFLLDDEGLATLVPEDRFFCIECGHCVAVCPTDAISMDGDTSCPVSDSASPSVQSPESLEQLEQIIKTRRSIRWYRDAPLPREALERALGIARYAPTARNAQQIEWCAIDSPEQLKVIGEKTARAFLGDPAAASVGQAYLDGKDMILRGAPCLVLAHMPASAGLGAQDCSAAVSYLELVLHASGIGSCWAGFVIRAMSEQPELRAFAGIPEGRQAWAGLLVGYSLEKYRKIPGRAPVRIAWK